MANEPNWRSVGSTPWGLLTSAVMSVMLAVEVAVHSMLSTLISQPLLAKCVTCVANETENGWWYFSGIIGGASLVVAGYFVWLDRRERASWPQLPTEL